MGIISGERNTSVRNGGVRPTTTPRPRTTTTPNRIIQGESNTSVRQGGGGGTGQYVNGVYRPNVGQQLGGQANPVGIQGPGSYKAFNPTSNRWNWFDADPTYTPPGGAPPYQPTGPGGGGGGGGGGGAAPIDSSGILALMNRQPQAYNYQNIDLPDYQAREFRSFNEQPYEQARAGLSAGLAADLATGNQAYADAGTELANYQNPFAGRSYSQNPQMSDAMQRMLSANGVQADAATQGQGVQADAAFGNVLALLGGAAGQQQASAQRALGGDQRRFNESLQSEGRNMGLGIDMARSRALDQYEKDKWLYGEQVAQQNYATNIQELTMNNQGQNQTAQQNTQMANTFNQGNTSALINLISSGVKIDPAMLQQYLGGA